MDWFEKLTGFSEVSYDTTRSQLEVSRGRLSSKANGLSYAIGQLETPSLMELRIRAQVPLGDLAGKIRVSCISGDVRDMHRDAANANALFQVASQFNLLEMVSPNVTPENGVTGYMFDHTQGPACAIAAGAATIYRNYLAEVDGQSGQRRDRQIDCLKDLGTALGNENGALWEMRNGYALCTGNGLAAIDQVIAKSDDAKIDYLRSLLRIGLHWDVEVTDAPAPRPLVSQAFCSALPVSYTPVPRARWKSFATLVLQALYEATLCAAVLNAARTGSNIVLLTQVGGGAFGNDSSWINDAQLRALDMFKQTSLDVRLVSYGEPSADLVRLADQY